jgi:hypothetical protein
VLRRSATVVTAPSLAQNGRWMSPVLLFLHGFVPLFVAVDAIGVAP